MVSEERIRQVEEFIERNPGLHKELIVEAMADYSSRTVVYDIIKELINTGRIIEKRENRREILYFSNDKSEYIIIKRQIDVFKKSFFELIQKSFDHPLVANTSETLTSTIDHNDKVKTSENLQILKSMPYEYLVAEEVYKVIRLAIYKIEYLYSNLYNSLYQPSIYKYTFDKAIIKSEEIKQIAKEINAVTTKMKPVIDSYYTVVKSSIYSRTHFWFIYIFLVFVHLINLRSVTIWPNIVKEMKDQSESLNILNKLAYDEILEINSAIIKSFSGSGNLFSGIQETMRSIPSTYQFVEKQSIMQMACDFKSINLDKEIESVMESLRKISDDDKNITSLEFYLQKINEFCTEVLDSKDF
ncbi:MAG: hypothetical protein L0H53_06445 [Candidatus Nitrosocosmicus sp.]|nr:hypothetical protein [Candidatus Nitrosocosmicus sp.]MDN5867135.1 hypothetical protein [Candidatus Nitrosocosmicus sp.]